MAVELTDRQRRWLDALLVLATIAVGFVVLGFIGDVFFFFGDIILIFFLAWLLAFMLSPIVTRLSDAIPFLPRIAAVILVYGLLLGALVVLAVLIAGALLTSIQDFAETVPTLQSRLPEILAPWQRRLDALGLSQVKLADQGQIFLSNLTGYAQGVVGPLQQFAVASLGAIASLVIVLVLSLYIAIDRNRVLSFTFRLVPPGFKEEARLLERSVARSFGGFLRGQALMGLIYGGIALLTSALLRLEYLPVTSALAGVLMAVPFFGPFVAWAPPVLVAIFVHPDATVPVAISMGIGWFVVMNLLQPRLMEEAVGIHPIAVLGSVLVGSKIAGIPGAIFGIPIAAILSAFFFHYLGRNRDNGPVASRAARRLEVREGRPVRVPREPDPVVDPDVNDTVAAGPSTVPGMVSRPSAGNATPSASPSPARAAPARRPGPATPGE